MTFGFNVKNIIRYRKLKFFYVCTSFTCANYFHIYQWKVRKDINKYKYILRTTKIWIHDIISI